MQRQTAGLSRHAPTLAIATTLTVISVVALPLTADGALSPDEDFQVPFACGESWEGGTRPSHSPSSLAVDWNRDSNDLGHLVIASSPGVVESVKDLGDSSYGLYVVIDHGRGWSTLHAHLLTSFVVPGQRIDQGQAIGQVGSSGSSSAPHLHYEQRLDRLYTHVQFDGTSFEYDSWLDSRNCPDVPVVGDWNGDRVSDVGTFRRGAAGGVLRQRLPGGARRNLPWGKSTDQPLVGDWNGDGQFEPGVWRQARQRFILAAPRPKPRRVRFGDARDSAIAGDWDGDGRWDVGTFDAGTTTFSLRNADGYVSTKVFGSVSSLPVTGDWDGDGRWGVGTFDPATATFRLDLGAGGTKKIMFGNKLSLPVIGKWNSDAVSDVGVWNTSTGVFSERLGPNRTRTIRFGHRR
ncbi:MAG: M23 family metallopeptidase [Nocardioidaceae bacterium]|nr:M23 family metallopeptidase [Nocardioidaceae bacterium]